MNIRILRLPRCGSARCVVFSRMKSRPILSVEIGISSHKRSLNMTSRNSALAREVGEMEPRERKNDIGGTMKEARRAKLGILQGLLGKELGEVYPLKKEKSKPSEPAWITSLEEWGTEQEMQKLEHAYKKRDNATRNSAPGAETSAPDQTPAATRSTTNMERSSRIPQKNRCRISYARRPIFALDKPRWGLGGAVSGTESGYFTN